MTHTKLFLIAYDLSSDKRRTKLHKTLSGYGQWTQYSFFECFLTEKQLISLRAKIDQIIHYTEDNVRIYPMCSSCQAKVETIGSKPPKEDKLYLI